MKLAVVVIMDVVFTFRSVALFSTSIVSFVVSLSIVVFDGLVVWCKCGSSMLVDSVTVKVFMAVVDRSSFACCCTEVITTGTVSLLVSDVVALLSWFIIVTNELSVLCLVFLVAACGTGTGRSCRRNAVCLSTWSYVLVPGLRNDAGRIVGCVAQ